MRFLHSKHNNIYAITRITGSQDNILGISFAEPNSSEINIEVLEWNFPNIDKSKIRTSKAEVLNQVVSGLELLNRSLGTKYKLAKIYFSAYDLPYSEIYSTLTLTLIRHYHKGNEFTEVKLVDGSSDYLD